LHKRAKGGILPAKESGAKFPFWSYSMRRLISSVEYGEVRKNGIEKMYT
jgi:hypothetical protein